jgi:hypothetical protein
MPVTLHLVPHVVLMRAKLKVSRVAARRVIALMPDVQAVRYLAIRQHERDSVCGPSPAAKTKRAVPALTACASPFPALIRACNPDLLPESIFRRYSAESLASLVFASQRAAFCAGYSALRNAEVFAANWT